MRREFRSLTCLMVLLLMPVCGHAAARGQEHAAPPASPAPVVSDGDREKAQTIALRLENAELRERLAQLAAQAARADFDKASRDRDVFVQSLQRDGYELDLQTLTYVKKSAPAAPAKDAKK